MHAREAISTATQRAGGIGAFVPVMGRHVGEPSNRVLIDTLAKDVPLRHQRNPIEARLLARQIVTECPPLIADGARSRPSWS